MLSIRGRGSVWARYWIYHPILWISAIHQRFCGKDLMVGKGGKDLMVGKGEGPNGRKRGKGSNNSLSLKVKGGRI